LAVFLRLSMLVRLSTDLPAPVYQPARNVAKGEASDHRHERLLVDLTRCSLDRVTPGSQHIVGHIACLGQGLPSGLLNSFARFPDRPFQRHQRERHQSEPWDGRSQKPFHYP
jgi:hypothetical protein